MSFDRRLVIDTGVLISAAIRPQSIPALAFEKALRQFDPCSSEETLNELKTVLLRPKFDRYLSRAVRQRFLDEYLLHTTVFPVTEVVTDCPDPKDNIFLALAETVEAELIITSDPHLTDLHPWRGIPIIPPRIFLTEGS